MIPILFGITLLTFFLFNVFGGDPALRFAGRHATPEMVQNLRAELGIDRSMPEQYLFFVKQIVTFDYGRSWATKQNISTMIDDGISASLCLTMPVYFFSIFFCIGLALLAVYYRATLFDKGTMIACLGLMSISSLVYIIVLQYGLSYKFGLFPISGWDPSWVGRWQYIILPWLILFILNLGPSILVYRSVIADEAFQDYVRTARAKGLSQYMVFTRHILKNAMIPIITIVVIELPFVITGTFLVEHFFSIPGLGGLMIKAFQDSDFPVIKAMTVNISILYMILNLFADVFYAAIDPRIKLS